MKHKTRILVTLALTLASLAFAGANIYDEYLIPTHPMESAYNKNRQWPGETDEEHAQRLDEQDRWEKEHVEQMLARNRKPLTIVFFVWSLFPLAALAAVTFLGERPAAKSFFGLSFFYAFAHASYAFNGPSDPMGAGHMHLVLVPMLLLLVTLAPLFLNFLDLFRGKGNKQAEVPAQKADETS